MDTDTYIVKIFLKRSSFTLAEIKPYLTSTHYLVFISFILFHLSLICIISIQLYKIVYKKKSHPIVITLSERLSYIIDLLYWKPLEYIHHLIAPNIPYSGEFFMRIEKYWTKHQYSKKYFYTLIILFDILPKIVIALTFLIEIVIYGHIKYFLYTISLILIPIFFCIFLKIFSSFAERVLPDMKSLFLEIKGIDPQYNDEGLIVVFKSYTWIIKPEYISINDGSVIMDYILQARNIIGYVFDMKAYITKVSPYITLITSSIYIIGGIYRLIFLW